MTLPNLLFLVTALPLIAMLVFPSAIGGMEGFAYLLKGTSDLPYFLQDFGFGISSGSPIIEGRLLIAYAYQIYFLLISAAVVFLGIGFSGLMYVAMKFVWQDTFITKKDSYGNNVPRVVKEFFIGLKKYWWQSLIVTAAAGIILAAVSNSIVFFIQRFWTGNAGAGEWILVIFACLFALFSLVVIIFLLPMVVEYDIPFLQKVKNAVLLAISMIVPTVLLLAVLSVPFIIAAVTSGIISIVIAALLIVFGGIFYSFALCNFMQYHADKIITPVYEADMARKNKKKKKK